MIDETFSPLDVMQMKRWGIRVSSDEPEDLIRQLSDSVLKLTAERKHCLDALATVQRQRDALFDSRNTWRLWCLMACAAMLANIVWGFLLWGR